MVSVIKFIHHALPLTLVLYQVFSYVEQLRIGITYIIFIFTAI